MRRKTQKEWVDGLAGLGVPCSPVNTIDQVFADPQVQHREMQIDDAPSAGGQGRGRSDRQPDQALRHPRRLSPAPPYLGQHSEEVLRELLGLDDAVIAELRREGAI